MPRNILENIIIEKKTAQHSPKEGERLKKNMLWSWGKGENPTDNNLI